MYTTIKKATCLWRKCGLRIVLSSTKVGFVKKTKLH